MAVIGFHANLKRLLTFQSGTKSVKLNLLDNLHFPSQILTLVSLNLLPLIRFIFAHNETDFIITDVLHCYSP